MQKLLAKYSIMIASLLASVSFSSELSSEPFYYLAESAINRVIDDSEKIQLAELHSFVDPVILSPQRKLEIEREIQSLENDTESLNTALINAVKRLRVLEAKISGHEEQLRRLEKSAQKIQVSLSKRQGILVEVLVALQRIGKHPPPALLVEPHDALTAVRSAILLNAVMPEIRSEALALSAELTELSALRESIEKDRNQFKYAQTRIVEENTRIESLLISKYRRIIDNEALLGNKRRDLEYLANKSGTLGDLLAAIDTKNETKDSRPAEQRETIQTGDESQQSDRQDPFLDLGRVAPAISFADAQGILPFPVHGEIIGQFGDSDGYGGNLSGQLISTKSRVIVSSPSDGWVEFAGNFRSFGNLLILDAGNGYYVLLAGMDKIDVQLGQFVLTGEPVGKMGTGPLTEIMNNGELDWEQPVLYIEFRKGDSPIDPNPWWRVTEEVRVRG